MIWASGMKLTPARLNGRGRIATATENSNSANITTTETTIASVTASLVAGRVYKVCLIGGVDASVAGDTCDARLRQDSSAGTEMQLRRVDLKDITGRWPVELEAEYTAVATGNKTFVATYVRASGTGNVIRVASGTIPTYLYVDYVRES